MHAHPPNGRAPRLAAAIDLGSNTLKMTIARLDREGITEVAWLTATVRLGMGLDATGRLAEDRIGAALAVLERFVEEARSAGATEIRAVGTEALRVAANGPETLERIRQHTGLSVELISGDREADLTFAGVMSQLTLDGPFVLADIGGASTELIVAEGGVRSFARSLPIGSGRMTDRFVVADPPTHAELALVQAATVEQVLAVAPPALPGCTLVVVGGTGQFLLALVPGTPKRVTTATMVDVRDRLTTLRAGELAPMLGIPELRARVLPAGSAIVLGLAEVLQPSSILATSSGIRRGVLMEMQRELVEA